jgi:hypothetical protein
MPNLKVRRPSKIFCREHATVADTLGRHAAVKSEVSPQGQWLAQRRDKHESRTCNIKMKNEGLKIRVQSVKSRRPSTGRIVETVLRGHVYELRADDAIVDMESSHGPERRLIDASQLRRAGVTHEGQPFVIRIREFRRGNSNWWTTDISPEIPSGSFVSALLRPTGDFARFARLG